MRTALPCPNCQSRNLYKAKTQIASGGGHAPNFLPGLGRWYRAGRFDIVVCRDCGRTVEVEGPAIESWTDRIAAEHGFSDVQHHLEVFGHCNNCAQNPAVSKPLPT